MKLIPASVTKLFTTAAALHYLGPNYTYNTILYRRGEITMDGALSGDLILRGTGDPTLSDRFSTSAANLFRDMADAVKNMGITAINGDIICDDSYFDALKAMELKQDDANEVYAKVESKPGWFTRVFGLR